LSEIIFLVEEAPEGGYTARAIGESIFTEADDLNDLNKMVQDAVRCHFDDDKMPTRINQKTNKDIQDEQDILYA